MKKGFMLLMIAVLSVNVSLFAQDNNKRRNDKPTKEQRVEMQVKRMSSNLMLNDAQSAKFAVEYKKYLDDMAALRMPRPEKKDSLKKSLTDAEQIKMMKDRFANQHKMINLKEKYYNEFCKFLTPAQAQKAISTMKQGKKGHGKMQFRDGRGMKGNKDMKNSKNKNQVNGFNSVTVQ